MNQPHAKKQPQQLSMVEEIKTIAEEQLGEWKGVSEVHQPAHIHHWQEVYDLACETADWERDQLARLKRENEMFRRLLHDVDQCAPAVLDTRELGLDFAAALQAVRDELGE